MAGSTGGEAPIIRAGDGEPAGDQDAPRRARTATSPATPRRDVADRRGVGQGGDRSELSARSAGSGQGVAVDREGCTVDGRRRRGRAARRRSRSGSRVRSVERDDAGTAGAGRGQPAGQRGAEAVDDLQAAGRPIPAGGPIPVTIRVTSGSAARPVIIASDGAPASTRVIGQLVCSRSATKAAGVAVMVERRRRPVAAASAAPGPTAATQPGTEPASVPSRASPRWAAAAPLAGGPVRDPAVARRCGLAQGVDRRPSPGAESGPPGGGTVVDVARRGSRPSRPGRRRGARRAPPCRCR